MSNRVLPQIGATGMFGALKHLPDKLDNIGYRNPKENTMIDKHAFIYLMLEQMAKSAFESEDDGVGNFSTRESSKQAPVKPREYFKGIGKSTAGTFTPSDNIENPIADSKMFKEYGIGGTNINRDIKTRPTTPDLQRSGITGTAGTNYRPRQDSVSKPRSSVAQILDPNNDLPEDTSGKTRRAYEAMSNKTHGANALRSRITPQAPRITQKDMNDAFGSGGYASGSSRMSPQR